MAFEDGIMDRLNQILNECYNLSLKDEGVIISREISKRNPVYSIALPAPHLKIVVKIFNLKERENSIANELIVYKILNENNSIISATNKECLIYAPKLFHSGRDFIIWEYVEGTNVMELINSQLDTIPDNDIFWGDLFSYIVESMIGFFHLTGYITSDNQLRNYTLKNTKLYRYDFEEIKKPSTNVDILNGFLDGYSDIYVSLLGSYPGIIEGKKIEYKARLGIVFIRCMFENKKIEKLIAEHSSDTSNFLQLFLNSIEKKCRKVIDRRIKFKYAENYSINEIELNLKSVMEILRAKFLIHIDGN